MIRELREQLQQARSNIEAQAASQEESLRSQAASQKAELDRQTEQAEASIRHDIGAFEKERSELAGQIRTEAGYEERQRAIGEYTPTHLHTEEQLRKLEQASGQMLGRSTIAREDIAKQKANALLDIDKALSDVLGQVKAQKEKILTEIEREYQRLSDEFEEENVEIAPDEWMSREEWDKLTPEQQSEVKSTGKYTITTTETRYPATGQEALQQLMDSGQASKNSVVISYDRNTGEVKYKEPDIEIPIISSGEVINDLQEPDLQTTTTTTTVIEVNTPTGKVQYAPDDWENLSDAKKLEASLGRPPTMAEYQAYHLQKYLVDKGYVTEHDINQFYGAFGDEQIPILSGFKHGIEVARALVQRLLPNWQKGELILNELNGAQHEWEMEYPDMATVGEVAEGLSGFGFPVAQVLYPQITKKDITTSAWVETGVSAILWTAPLWLPKVAQVATERVASITPETLRIEFQRTYSVAKDAGNAKSVMEKAISKLESTQITDPNYARVASNAQKAINDSISADLKFIDRYSSLDSVNLSEVARFEKASKMNGLTQATKDVVSKRKAYEAILKKVKSDTLIQDATLRNKLIKARDEFTGALDKFETIAQPRASFWRVTPPEKVVQTGLDVKVTKTPVNPEFQKLLDSIYDYQIKHPVVSPESKSGVATALKPQKVIAKPSTITEIKPKYGLEPTEVVKPKVKPTVPKVTEEKPTTPVPEPTKPSVFPMITRTREPQYEPIVEEEHLGAMTPEQAQRFREGTETTTEAIGQTIEGATITTISPAISTRIRDITQAASGYAYQLKNLGWTDAQIQSQVQQYIANKIALEAYPETKQALQQQARTITETALQTIMQTEIGVKTQIKVGIGKTAIIPVKISGKGKQWEGGKIPAATFVWTMGFPRGHDEGMWNILPPPYEQLYFDKVIPAGAVIKARGKGSATANLQMIGGTPSKDIDKVIDIGATLLHIKVVKGQPMLSFTRDPEDAYKGKPDSEVESSNIPIETIVQPKIEKPYQVVKSYIRTKKPNHDENWWDDEYYQSKSEPQHSGATRSRTYYGHSLIDIPALTGKELV